jgi:hypothetical protein
MSPRPATGPTLDEDEARGLFNAAMEAFDRISGEGA